MTSYRIDQLSKLFVLLVIGIVSSSLSGCGQAVTVNQEKKVTGILNAEVAKVGTDKLSLDMWRFSFSI